MTDREKAIISAYTGIAMLTGDKFSIFHKYVEDILGRSVWTHELADRAVWEEIKEKSKADFLAICAEAEPETPKFLVKTKKMSKEEMKRFPQAWKNCQNDLFFTTDDFEIIPIKKPAEWIPITTRKLTKEEKEKAAEEYGMKPEDFDDGWVFTCPLPDIDQEVLVTTKIWGNVVIDTFVDDGEGASYFEDHDDEDDLLAWMPLPEPYKDPLDHSDEPIRCKADKCSPEGCKHCAEYEPINFGGDEDAQQ